MTATPAEGSPSSLTIPTAATIGALGVVYGDIGTSPLYALKEAAKAATGHVSGAAITGRGARRGVADPVVADPDHLDQVRAADPARGQPRRRRHRRPARAAVGAQRATRQLARAAPDRRPDRRRAALWRRRHHARDLGAERDRRVGGRRAVAGAGRRADHHRHSGRRVRDAEQGTGVIGQIFGPVMLVWFVVLALLGIHGIVQGAGRARSTQPVLCLRFPDPPEFSHQLCDPRRGLPGGDRRRGDVRRHGAFRPGADPARLVRHRAAGAGAELFWPGGGAHHRSQRDRSSVLPARAGLGALSAGRAVRPSRP